jgi:hypothetical protein
VTDKAALQRWFSGKGPPAMKKKAAKKDLSPERPSSAQHAKRAKLNGPAESGNIRRFLRWIEESSPTASGKKLRGRFRHDGSSAPPITVVLNWQALLKK